jgi:hypothetical protein
MKLHKNWLAMTAIAALSIQACVAGSGNSGSTGGGGTVGLVAQGKLATNIDSKDIAIDYSKADVTVTMTHKQTSDALACVPSLTITAEIPTTKNGVAVHMCKLELDFNAGFAGEGLLLTGAKFYARQGIYASGALADTVDCAGWTTEPAKGEVVYELTATQDPPTIGVNTIAQPFAGQASAVMSNVLLSPSGALTLKFKGRQFNTTLDTLKFKGDVTSTGDANASCAKTYHDLPSWQLPDINPTSTGFNSTYGLEALHGKRIILDMGAGWCAACIAQADVATPIHTQLVAQGRTDVAFMQIIDVNTPEEMFKHTEEPLMKGAWSVHKQVMPDGTTKTADKSDAFAYDYDGRLMGYFEGNGTVYTDSYGEFINHVISADKEKPDYIFCATGGLHVGGKSGCVITAE